MRHRFLLIPAAICASASAGPAFAGAYYLTGDQAQQLLFPGATFDEAFIILTDQQIRDIESESHAPLTDRKVRVWKVSTGGWFFIDQVVGLDSTVTYAIGLDPKGNVKGIEVMECWEQYSQVRLPEWRAQFKGKHFGDLYKKGEIENISGTTLSSVHITEGVRRILTTYSFVMENAKS